MKRCPRCELLLLDTDSECPRCHAPVEVTMSSDEAREQRDREVSAWRKKRERVDQETGAYLPPWAPPATLFLAGFVAGLVQTYSVYRKTQVFEMNFLIGVTVVSLALIVGAATAYYFAQRNDPGSPVNFERSLLTVSGMALLISVASLIVSYLAFVESPYMKAGIRLGLIYLVIKMSSEASTGKSVVLVTLCGLFFVVGAYIAWQVFAAPNLQGMGSDYTPF